MRAVEELMSHKAHGPIYPYTCTVCGTSAKAIRADRKTCGRPECVKLLRRRTTRAWRERNRSTLWPRRVGRPRWTAA